MAEQAVHRFGNLTINYDARRVPIRSSDRKSGKYPYYGASGIVDYIDGYLYDGEYLLIAEDGENLRTRKTPIAFIASGRFWVNNHAHVVIGNQLANTRYLCYALEKTDISGYLSGSTQPKLTQAALNRIELSLPERKKQDAIVEVLCALDDKIAANDRIESAYKRILSLKFEQLQIDVEPELTRRCAINEMINFNPRLNAPMGQAVYLDMAALPTADTRIKDPPRRKSKSGTRFANGDTVIARITPCLENGKTGFIDFMEDGEIGVGSTEFIVMRARPGIPTHLPYFLARSARFRDNAIRNMIGSSGRQRVSAAQLFDFPVRQPNEGELADFAAAASIAFAHMKSLGAESTKVAELRDTLLPKLMSGELRVRDAEKVVEEAT